MEKAAYDRFRGRRTQRWKAFTEYIGFFVILLIVGTIARYYAGWLIAYLFGIGLLGFLVGLFYLGSRPWARERLETDIFVDLYDASTFLNLVSSEDENSHFYSQKAAKKLERAIRGIGDFAYELERVNSAIAEKRFAGPFRTLERNLETRILPRVSKQKDVQDMASVLHGLVQIFSETVKPLTLEAITSKSKDLERFEEIVIPKEPSKFRTAVSKEPVKLSYDMFLGVVIVFAAFLVHSVLFKYNLVDALSNPAIFIGILGVGVTIGIGINGIRIVTIRRE